MKKNKEAIMLLFSKIYDVYYVDFHFVQEFDENDILIAYYRYAQNHLLNKLT